MNGKEFEERFDVLYNNIASNEAPGLNTYEKSLFLTKSQDELLKNYFNPAGNKYQQGYDGSPKRQIDFSAITKVVPITQFSSALYDARAESKSATLPSDIWMIVNEKVKVERDGDETTLIVKAISFEEYDRLMSKPYKRPLKYQAWRLINNDSSNKSDLIVGPADSISDYTIRYVRKPHPIITGPLDDLTINGYGYGGENTPQVPSQIDTTKVYGDKACELDPSLHEEILQRAVELAKISWTVTGQDNTQLVMTAGQRSE